MTHQADAGGQVLCRARERNALLTQGLRRILRATSALPGVTRPLQEVLRLSEQQALLTLEAVCAAQAENRVIGLAHGDCVEQGLARVERHLQSILAAQQCQDLAGQRLKTTIARLQAVEARIREGLLQLRKLGFEAAVGGAQAHAGADADTFGAGRLDQEHVDDLLSQLGI